MYGRGQQFSGLLLVSVVVSHHLILLAAPCFTGFCFQLCQYIHDIRTDTPSSSHRPRAVALQTSMPEPANEQKRRPPPVLVPSRSRPSTSSSNQSNTYSRISDTHREPRQQRQHVPSAASLPTARASPVTPPLTSFSDQDHLRMSRAESQSSRTPAHRRLADLMEQVVTDPRASSELSEAQSPTTAKTPDEKSVRGRIESRNKQSFYNMTNHAIPANISSRLHSHLL